MSARIANRRIRLLVALFAVVFAAALVRAGWLQAVQAPALDRLASDQYRQTVAIPARRGTISDANGVELAVGERATTVYANPREIVDARAAAVVAGEALGLDPDALFRVLSDRSKGFVYIARKADPETAEQLAREKIPGLGFYPEERRAYPLGDTAAEVIGYAGLDNEGLDGLELQLDRELSGSTGSKTIVRDPGGRTIDVVQSKPVVDGSDVRLTIDHVIQRELERVLQKTRERWSAATTTGVVLDPRTGAILAMAVEPGYDANRFPEVTDDLQRNRAVTDTYEPGSTLKVVAISAELERGDVDPWTTFTLPPTIQVSDRVIKEHDPRGTETMTVSQILAESSNVGTVTLALRLGKPALSQWIRRFGFGRRTGIDFPGESPGIVPGLDDWSGSTIGTLPIGHGIAVTAVQMAAAYGALANKGVWNRPHLVARIEGRDAPRPERRRILTIKTAATVRKMLSRVVSEGTGTEAQIPGYSIAGKTGTAAKPDPEGGYSKTRYVGSFVGFLPVKSPRVVILVAVDEPRGTIWGGTVAAPAFAEIATFLAQYLEIAPDRPAQLAAATG